MTGHRQLSLRAEPWARSCFLEMIVKVAPVVVEDLHANASNLYCTAYKHFELNDNLLKREYIKHVKHDYLPELVPLKQELRSWKREINVQKPSRATLS